jgi:hypothetical protein
VAPPSGHQRHHFEEICVCKRGKITLLSEKYTVTDFTWSVNRQSLLHYTYRVLTYITGVIAPRVAPPSGHQRHHFEEICVGKRGKITLLSEKCTVTDFTWSVNRQSLLHYTDKVSTDTTGVIAPRVAPPSGHQRHHFEEICVGKRGKHTAQRKMYCY